MILAVKEFKVQSPTKIVFLIFTSNLSRMVNSVEYMLLLWTWRECYGTAQPLEKIFKNIFLLRLKTLKQYRRLSRSS